MRAARRRAGGSRLTRPPETGTIRAVMTGHASEELKAVLAVLGLLVIALTWWARRASKDTALREIIEGKISHELAN